MGDPHHLQLAGALAGVPPTTSGDGSGTGRVVDALRPARREQDPASSEATGKLRIGIGFMRAFIGRVTSRLLDLDQESTSECRD